MLDWFKRVATPVSSEQSVENERKVERLLDRIGTDSRTASQLAGAFAPGFSERLAENENRTLPAAEKVEQLQTRLGAFSAAANQLAERFTQTYVIAVACQKGGSGKTTIAAHLAVQAGKAGQGPAALIDTDPQGSLGEWWRARDDDTLALATVKLDDLVANPAALRSRGAAIAIIDTP